MHSGREVGVHFDEGDEKRDLDIELAVERDRVARAAWNNYVPTVASADDGNDGYHSADDGFDPNPKAEQWMGILEFADLVETERAFLSCQTLMDKYGSAEEVKQIFETCWAI